MHMQLHTVVINVMLICARCLLLLRAALSMYVLHTRVPCSLSHVACAILVSRAWLLPIGTLFSFRFLLIPFSFLASIYLVVKSTPSQWNFPTRSGFVAVLGVPCPGSIPSRTSWLVRVWLLSAAFPLRRIPGMVTGGRASWEKIQHHDPRGKYDLGCNSQISPAHRSAREVWPCGLGSPYKPPFVSPYLSFACTGESSASSLQSVPVL